MNDPVPIVAGWRSRLRASAIHLACSAAVAALAAGLVFLVWYPPPFTTLAGGLGLFTLLTSVDVVIGPLLTLAIFDRRKPMPVLRRDLGVLVTLQLAALAYGLHTMYIARPAVMALEGNRLRVVAVTDVRLSELDEALPAYRALPITGPLFVRTANPTVDQKFEAIRLALAGYDVGTRPTYWRPWDDVARAEVRRGAQPLATLFKRYPARAEELRAAVAKSGVAAERVGFLPVISRHDVAVALVDTTAGEIVGYAPFDGF